MAKADKKLGGPQQAVVSQYEGEGEGRGGGGWILWLQGGELGGLGVLDL